MNNQALPSRSHSSTDDHDIPLAPCRQSLGGQAANLMRRSDGYFRASEVRGEDLGSTYAQAYF